jgi:hypothetical protein
VSDEDDYFRKLDQEAKEKLRRKLAAENATAERQELARLHHHRCGKCGGQMHSQHFRGMLIEKCEDCSAVLLDPGELEALAGKDSTDVFASFFTMFGGGKR